MDGSLGMEVHEDVEMERQEVVVMPWWAPGWGRGWGWRWWFWATGMPGWMRWAYFTPWTTVPSPALSPKEELEMLEEMKRELEAELEDIKKRIEELKKEMGK